MSKQRTTKVPRRVMCFGKISEKESSWGTSLNQKELTNKTRFIAALNFKN